MLVMEMSKTMGGSWFKDDNFHVEKYRGTQHGKFVDR
jgi:hypothetical protein